MYCFYFFKLHRLSSLNMTLTVICFNFCQGLFGKFSNWFCIRNMNLIKIILLITTTTTTSSTTSSTTGIFIYYIIFFMNRRQRTIMNLILTIFTSTFWFVSMDVLSSINSLSLLSLKRVFSMTSLWSLSKTNGG